MQKLQERSITFQRTPKVPNRDREKLTKVLIADMMSSEESGGSDDDTIVVRPLPWRAPKISQFFSVLSETAQGKKSRQAQRQTKKRVIGEVSSRPKPTSQSIPKWAFTDDPL